jgi:hypothetical protein
MLKRLLPSHYYLILISYLEDRFISVRIGSTISPPAGINAGVPQSVGITPLLFNLFIPDSNQTLIGDFVDDKAVIVSSAGSNIASLHI